MEFQCLWDDSRIPEECSWGPKWGFTGLWLESLSPSGGLESIWWCSIIPWEDTEDLSVGCKGRWGSSSGASSKVFNFNVTVFKLLGNVPVKKPFYWILSTVHRIVFTSKLELTTKVISLRVLWTKYYKRGVFGQPSIPRNSVHIGRYSTLRYVQCQTWSLQETKVHRPLNHRP